MCGRFLASTPVSDLADRLGAGEVTVEEWVPRYNVAPTDAVVAVATSRHGTRRLGRLSWGLVPHWVEGPRPGKRLINLRSETLADRPGFRTILQRRRCIVPADGFYEWRPAGPGRAKQPFLIRAVDGSLLAMAGLWDVWSPTGAGADPDARLRTCTVLTTGPNALVATLHDRMPVLLPPDAWDAWLDPSVTDLGELLSLLRPCSDDLLELVPVGTRVNSVKNDDPNLIEPVEL